MFAMNNPEQDTLPRLLKLIDASPGFAALGTSVQLISKLSAAEDGGTGDITAAILRDAALTARLLRLANSSRNARSGRNVSTIDQAIAILGLNTVKSVALSLALLDTMANNPQARLLNAEIVAAYFCGAFCAEVTRVNGGRYSAQEAQVCGLMQNLGRMMALYHLYPEIERSQCLLAERNLTEDEAIIETLGLGFEEIGAAIAAHWTLPDVLLKSIAIRKEKAPPRSVNTPLEWHQYCALFSRSITDLLFRLSENRENVELNQEVEYFRLVLRLNYGEVREWLDKTFTEVDRLLGELGFPCNIEQSRIQLRKASERVHDLLSAQDSLTRKSKLAEGKSPVEIFQQVLRQFHDKYGFDLSLLCLPDGSSGLVAVAGVGRNASQIAARFRCQGAKPDVFRIVFNKKIDFYIADTQAATYAKYIPEWHVELVGARSMLLLTLVSGGQPVGLLYGDYSQPHAEAPPGIISEPCVREWREQLQIVLHGQGAKGAGH